jgi:hypothetical protein
MVLLDTIVVKISTQQKMVQSLPLWRTAQCKVKAYMQGRIPSFPARHLLHSCRRYALRHPARGGAEETAAE